MGLRNPTGASYPPPPPHGIPGEEVMELERRNMHIEVRDEIGVTARLGRQNRTGTPADCAGHRSEDRSSDSTLGKWLTCEGAWCRSPQMMLVQHFPTV